MQIEKLAQIDYTESSKGVRRHDEAVDEQPGTFKQRRLNEPRDYAKQGVAQCTERETPARLPRGFFVIVQNKFVFKPAVSKAGVDVVAEFHGEWLGIEQKGQVFVGWWSCAL